MPGGDPVSYSTHAEVSTRRIRPGRTDPGIPSVSRRAPGTPGVGYLRYVAGEWNAPPEDSGGTPGFYEKLDAAADPNHPDHDEIKEWLGDYDPSVIDETQIKITLGRIAKRRNAAAARLAKPRT